MKRLVIAALPLLLCLSTAFAQTKRVLPLKSVTNKNALITAVSTSHSVSLSWIASTSTNVTSYNVYRSGTSGGFVAGQAYVTGVACCSYVDTGVSANLTYFYVVTAVCAGCSPQESIFSNQVTAVIPADPQPQPPTGLGVTAVAKLDLSGWKDVLAWQPSPSATTDKSIVYRVYRSTHPSCCWSWIKGGLTTTSYVDKSTTLGSTYYYYVTAYSTAALLASGRSNEVSVTIPSVLP